MKLSLAQKILLPYSMLGLLMLALLAALFTFNMKERAASDRETTQREIKSSVQAISARVQNGILTRQDSYAIDAAKQALRVDDLLSKLEQDGSNYDKFRKEFEGYLSRVVATNSLFLENRVDVGTVQLTQVRALEKQMDVAMDRDIKSAAAESARLIQLGQTLQIGALAIFLISIVVVTVLVKRNIINPLSGIAGALRGVSREGSSGDHIEDIAAQMKVAAAKYDRWIYDHQAWKTRLMACVDGTSTEKLDPEVVAGDGKCDLGKWLRGDGQKFYAGTDLFRQIVRDHQEVHAYAGKVAKLVASGEPSAESFSTFSQALLRLTLDLNKFRPTVVDG